MARPITPEIYLALIDQIRSRIPEIAITTDILTGFPGESDQEFQESLDFIDRIGFAGGHVFSFSAREGTPAALLPNQVPHSIRKARNAEIRKNLQRSEEGYRRGFLDRDLSVLWEQTSEIMNGICKLVGLSDNYLKVEAEGPADLWNRFSRVRVDEVVPAGVQGTILDK
jgi:threonylcarbamoyladenosine tRNA methylthiotransferase MtaB